MVSMSLAVLLLLLRSQIGTPPKGANGDAYDRLMLDATLIVRA
jgi:hypothetical protein